MKRMFMISLCFACFSGDLFAQRSGRSDVLRSRDLESDVISSPEYEYKVQGTTRRDGNRDWLQITYVFDTAPDWIDELTLTFYVVTVAESQEQVGEGKELKNILSERVTYVNVAEGTHRARMYMHPSFLNRYGEVTHLAVVASAGGEEVGIATEPTVRSPWWTQKAPIPGGLMPQQESPFRFVEIDMQEALKR